MAILHKCSHEQMHDLSMRLVAIEQDLHRVNMHATARRVNAAVQAIGWEFAGQIEQIDHQQNAAQGGGEK
jgi:hypothetical protein